MAHDVMVKNDKATDPKPDQIQLANTSLNSPAPSTPMTVSSARVTAGVADCNTNSGSNSQSNSNINGPSHPPLQSTVFIHKLYNILEDDDLKDLIWWSPNGLSFLIRPTEKFSRGLATYFKHTNIASFVRQLNMYGFHKVSNDHGKNLEHDANNNNNKNGSTDGQEDIKIWKFRHSTGLFKRGDVEGLKYIKRRSSRNISNSNTRKNSNHGSLSTNNCNGTNTVCAGISTKGVQGEIQAHDELLKDQFQRPLSQQQPPQEQPAQHRLPYQQPQQIHQQRGALPEVDSCFFPSPRPSQTQQPLPYASCPPHSTSVNVPSSGSDPFLESRYTELSQSHNVLRYEYNSLQYRYDEMFDELRGINMDMVHLLELVESLVTIQSSPEQQKHDLNGLEQELIRFKTLLLNRLHRNSEVQIQQQLQKNTRENHPLSSPSVATSHSAVSNFVQHVFSVPARTASNMNVMSQASTGQVSSGASTSSPAPPPPPQSIPSLDHFSGSRMTMMNPFETTGNSSKRNMSILMDPLAPAPNLMVTASPSRPSPYMNPSPATTTFTNYRTPRQTDKYSRVSVIAPKNSHSSITSDSSSGSSCLSHQNFVRMGTPTGHHIDAGAGVPPIKQEQQEVISMTEPRRPPSTKEQGDILRPIPRRSIGPSESIRGSSAVYSLLNDEQPRSSSLDNERTAEKEVNL